MRKSISSSSRRKSTGNPQQVCSVAVLRFMLFSYVAPQDEFRLLKRKEQNRAAQRAFRERKEKHVKDVSVGSNNISKAALTEQTYSLRIKLPPSRPKTKQQNQKTRISVICCHGYKARTWPLSRPNSLSQCQRMARFMLLRRTIRPHRMRMTNSTSREQVRAQTNLLQMANHLSPHHLTLTSAL